MNLSYYDPRVELLTLTTPINATQAFTFGLPAKNVSAICITLSYLHDRRMWASAFLLQLTLASSLTTACKFLLKPFVQASIVGQIMGGIMGGPSGLGHNLEVTLPFKSLYILETFASFGCILYVFLVGVKTDVSLIKRTGEKEWKIGVSAFIFPILAGIPACFFLKRNLGIDHELQSMLVNVSFLASSSTFHSIACFLDDLKLLNSELGRIALPSSMVSGAISYVAMGIRIARSKTNLTQGGYRRTVSAICLIIFILCPLRYLLIWIIKRTPERERVKESYLGFIVLLVLGTAFAGDVVGIHALTGPALLGLVLPDGSALAASLMEKVEAFVTFIIVPLYFLSCGLFTDLRSISSSAYFAVQFLAVLSFSAKFLGVTLVSVFLCDFALKDAIILGLMLSAVGVLDIQYYRRGIEYGLIDYRCFGVLITSGMIIVGFISFVVKALYDPFARYIAHERHTIQHFPNNVEFRILACIHSQEYVPSIIDLLEASNPTRESPICIYVLHLIELVGRVSPLFVHQSLGAHYPHDHHQHHRKHANSVCKPSENIINAFRIFERNNNSLVTFQVFTAISPRATMHNDVCMLSVDKRTRLIIIPFHIKWTGSDIATESPELRSVNLKVIDTAPCSVGILIDRGSKGGPRSVQGSWSLYRVGVFFIGGPDDREAVSYATRMAKNPRVTVTVMRLIAFLEIVDNNNEEKRLDSVTISNFRQTNATGNRAVYKEEILTDSAEACHFFRSIENEFDLILVGRRTESPLLLGLSDWKEYPELGLIGDLLASQDFKGKVSILVVQQHIVESRIILDQNSNQEEDLLHQNSTTAIRRSENIW
ncbi:cation/H(+) antiporter 15-like [Durio zibethinus]|uniref:Cation/H(+) antiporter 15-like n=1 Tax=Durio zibethinus TaxID=66656 RepID=A0A6P5Z743_DURZI|nr:cation/H(+) antiporter 15-like [Durio zibethinus]